MREIEIKARVRNKTALLTAAGKLGIKFGKTIHQQDTTYESNLSHDDPRWTIFRLRKENDTTILTMKYKASKHSGDNHEAETVIEDEHEIAKMLERLGYIRSVYVHKARRVAKYNDISLCLDDVTDLGCFIEAEQLASGVVNVDEIRDTLGTLLAYLGVDLSDRVDHGYDTLMRLHMSHNL